MSKATQIIHAVEKGLKSYIKDRLFQIIEYKGTDYEINIPLTGRKTIVRFLNLSDNRSYVMRIYMKNELEDMYRHRLAEFTFADTGVNYPQIIDYIDDPAKYGALILVEERLIGKTVNEVEYSTELSDDIAFQTASLHNIRSDQYGTLDKLRDEKFFKYLLRRISNRIKGIRRSSIITEKKQLLVISKWFKDWEDKFQDMIIFNLTHDKLNRSNFLFSDNGKIYLLDFATLQYGYLGKDLVKMHHSFCDDNTEKIKIFNDAYFKNLSGKNEQQRFETLQPLYHAWYHLSACAAQCKRYKKSLEYKSAPDRSNKEIAISHFDAVKKLSVLHGS